MLRAWEVNARKPQQSAESSSTKEDSFRGKDPRKAKGKATLADEWDVRWGRPVGMTLSPGIAPAPARPGTAAARRTPLPQPARSCRRQRVRTPRRIKAKEGREQCHKLWIFYFDALLNVKSPRKDNKKLRILLSACFHYIPPISLSYIWQTYQRTNTCRNATQSNCDPDWTRETVLELDLWSSQPDVLWSARGPGHLSRGGRHVFTDIKSYCLWLIPPNHLTLFPNYSFCFPMGWEVDG